MKTTKTKKTTKKLNELISQSLNVTELNTLKGGIVIDDVDMF